MASWLPVEIETQEAVSQAGNAMWIIHGTVVAGERAGERLRALDYFMRKGDGKPMARRKLHGILDRSVSADEWNRMQPWMIDGIVAWVHLDAQWSEREGAYIDKVDKEGTQYLGWRPEWFMDWRSQDDAAWRDAAASSDFDSLPREAWGLQEV